jgi:chitinase
MHTKTLLFGALFSVLAQAQMATPYIVGYWEGSGTPNVSHLTHLNYAFASIVLKDGSYTCRLRGNAATLTSQFQSFKTANPALKILISIGGAGQSPADFTNASQDPNFASNCVAETLGLLGNSADGIDIDWEFPSATDGQNYTNLMQNLRAALPPNGVLTAAVGMGPTENGRPAQNAYVPFSSILTTVDFFNVMTYRAYSTKKTTFGAPLFAPDITGYGTYNGTVDTTITDLIENRQVPPIQLVMGIPFYGVNYPSVQTEGSNFGLFEEPSLVDNQAALAIPYNQIVPMLSKTTVTQWCDTGGTSGVACPSTWGQPLTAASTAGSQETWIYDSEGAYGDPSVTTFDDPGSIAAKVSYALSNQLGGVMVWELMQDTDDNALLNTIAKCMPQPAPPSDIPTGRSR